MLALCSGKAQHCLAFISSALHPERRNCVTTRIQSKLLWNKRGWSGNAAGLGLHQLTPELSNGVFNDYKGNT